MHTCGPEHGPIVMLLHGFGTGGTALNMRYAFSALAALGFRVLGPDFPGFGRSTGDRQSSRTERMLDARGPVSTVCQLLTHFGVTRRKPGILVGYDWGAAIALCTGLVDLGQAVIGTTGNASQPRPKKPRARKRIAVRLSSFIWFFVKSEPHTT